MTKSKGQMEVVQSYSLVTVYEAVKEEQQLGMEW